MRRVVVFNHVSLDGYFVDMHGDMSWAHKNDSEWQAFVEENARGGGELLFGRITYELMVSYWPTPEAIKNDPIVAAGMNKAEKIVFSRTLDRVDWNNTRLVKSDMIAEIRKLKQQSGTDLTVLGSGSIVSQLAQERLIDEFQILLNPVVIGRGKTMFEGVKDRFSLKLTKTRVFGNGNILLNYEPIR